MSLSRRGFLASSGFAVGALGTTSASASSAPNVLCLVADRLPGDLLGPTGVLGADLPTLRRIGASWVRFDAASAVMVGDQPAWDGLWLGRPGSETGAMSEGQRAGRSLPDLVGWVAEHTGMDPVAAGRTGLGGRPSTASLLCDDVGNLAVLRAMQGFFRNRPPGRPWFAAVGLRGLRELDAWAAVQSADTPPVDLGLAPRDLPQPPPTLRSGAPQPQLLLEHAPAPSDWTDGHWQAALWQSARLLESLDGVLHRLLASLDASLHGQNTVVVLTAAQGSPLARHGRLRPDDLSEGSVRVPLAVRWPWERAPESIATPVSLLDLAPTLCAVLGIPGLPDARGLNLRPLLDGYPAPRRTEVVTEGFVEGRSVRSREFRHTTWRDDPVARLTHLPSDPHEERNLADNPGYSSTVDTHREALRLWEAGLRLVPGAKAGWPGDLR